MNILRDIADLVVIAVKELAQVGFCTACVLVPVALWYTGAL